jgi:uncharacterized cupin superfamily protein
MSQEEEKLIEEFKKHTSLWAWDKNEEKNAEILICKAYRSGKLAGFEVCENKIIKFENSLNKELKCSCGSHTEPNDICPYCMILEKKETISDIKSLIEEEKKKL